MRAALLGQLVGAQFELERALAEMIPGNGGSALAEGQQQLRMLKDLQAQIGTAGQKDLSAMRAAIGAAVTGAQTALQQSRTAANQPDAALLAEVAQTSREQVATLMRDMHRFDPDLRFASADDETAYRQREAARRADTDAQQAKHNPQGDLNAAGGVVGQMADAKAHGAGDNPEFQQRWNELVATTEKLRDEVRRNGGSTAEFDKRLRDDLRGILKSKGLTDVQIDAQFAAHPDPLEAAKAFVSDSRDFGEIQRGAERAVAMDAANSGPALENTKALIAAMQSSTIAGGCGHEGPPEHGIAERCGASGIRSL